MKYGDLPQMAIVQTINPPVIGVWLWAKEWADVERIDAAVHRWSMNELYRRAGH